MTKKSDDFFTENEDNILNYNNIKGLVLSKFLDDMESYIEKISFKDGKRIESITNGQVRVLYNLINQTESLQELQLVRPKIAFVAAKQNSETSKKIIKSLLNIISKTELEEQHQSIKNFMASFLHYHKFYNPSNN